jgi:hypothetical protein
MPRLTGTQDGIQDDEEFAHAGHESDLLELAGLPQALIEGTDDRVEADGGKSRHVQDGPHLSPPAPNGTRAVMLTAVVVEGSEPDQGGDALAGQGAQFGEIGQEGVAGSRADALEAPQQIILLAPGGES